MRLMKCIPVSLVEEAKQKSSQDKRMNASDLRAESRRLLATRN